MCVHAHTHLFFNCTATTSLTHPSKHEQSIEVKKAKLKHENMNLLLLLQQQKSYFFHFLPAVHAPFIVCCVQCTCTALKKNLLSTKLGNCESLSHSLFAHSTRCHWYFLIMEEAQWTTLWPSTHLHDSCTLDSSAIFSIHSPDNDRNCCNSCLSLPTCVHCKCWGTQWIKSC